MDNGLVHIMNKIRVLLNAVLILVVVDNGLVLKLMSMVINEKFSVLILVVVDNGLVLVDMVDGDFDYGS